MDGLKTADQNKDEFEEVPQNIGMRGGKCEKLKDMKLDREGLIYICYVSQKEWGEHGRVKEYWGPKGIRAETFSQLIKDILRFRQEKS